VKGHWYFVSFIDDFSCYVTVYLLHRKSDLPDDAFQAFLESAQIGSRTLRVLHSDQGSEYTSKELTKILEDNHVRLSTTPSHTPELNGVAERFNRTIVTMVRGLLLTSGLDSSFWAEALRFAVYVNNRLMMKANKDKRTPHERWTGEPSMLKHVRTFGCRAFVLRPGLHNKLQSF